MSRPPAEPILSLVLMPWMSASAKDDLPQRRSTMQRLHHGDETCLLRSPWLPAVPWSTTWPNLEQAASRDHQLARQRLHQKRGGEILTTSLAFPASGRPGADGGRHGDRRSRAARAGHRQRARCQRHRGALATTTERDAFRLQLSIPIERPREAVRALAINAAFSWDFERGLE